jgi:flagellar motor switch/type III secretory pathway protein FliN
MHPEMASVTQHLYAEAPCSSLSVGGQAQRWHWRPVQTRHGGNARLTLDIAGQCCRLTVCEDGGGIADRSIELAEFESDALRLAGALRYARLLEHIEQLLGAPVTLMRVEPAGAAELDAAGTIALGFELTSDAQPDTRCSGCLQVPVDMHPRLLGLGGSPRATSALPDLPCEVELLLDVDLQLTRTDLRELRVGGALLLGHVGAAGRRPCLIRPLQAAAAWPATWQGSTLLFDKGPRTPRPSASTWSARHTNMNPPNTTAAVTQPQASQAPETAAAGLLDSLPVRLEFLVGQLSLPQGELRSAIAAGGVLQLGHPLDAATVEVRANGVTVARGELVEVGDVLAVRISRIEGDGLL